MAEDQVAGEAQDGGGQNGEGQDGDGGAAGTAPPRAPPPRLAGRARTAPVPDAVERHPDRTDAGPRGAGRRVEQGAGPERGRVVRPAADRPAADRSAGRAAGQRAPSAPAGAVAPGRTASSTSTAGFSVRHCGSQGSPRSVR